MSELQKALQRQGEQCHEVEQVAGFLFLRRLAHDYVRLFQLVESLVSKPGSPRALNEIVAEARELLGVE